MILFIEFQNLGVLWESQEEAKESYDEAIKADENSPWAKLAKSAIDL